MLVVGLLAPRNSASCSLLAVASSVASRFRAVAREVVRVRVFAYSAVVLLVGLLAPRNSASCGPASFATPRVARVVTTSTGAAIDHPLQMTQLQTVNRSLQ